MCYLRLSVNQRDLPHYTVYSQERRRSVPDLPVFPRLSSSLPDSCLRCRPDIEDIFRPVQVCRESDAWRQPGLRFDQPKNKQKIQRNAEYRTT